MIAFNQVSMVYGGRREALRGLDLHIERGEMVFVTGHSGAGKSTLLRLVALIERVTRGTLVVDGQNVERIDAVQLPYYRRKIGFIFQDHRLLADRSVFDNVALPMVIGGYGRAEIERRVRAALDKVGLLGREAARPVELSSGEQQRVGIARAVVHRPAILLADEPTGNLDPELALEVMRLFEQFQQVGVTVVVATHALAIVESLPHRAVQLRGGALVDAGSAAA